MLFGSSYHEEHRAEMRQRARDAAEAPALRAEVERLREEHREFVEGLTEALNAHGVPACSSWRDAIDYLAYHGGRERNV